MRGEAPQTTLLDYLRSRGLTGAKEGCAEGECGSCTVVMVRPCGEGSAYQPVNSCLMFLPMAAGHEIYTVEALSRGGLLHPAQRAMAKAGGSQCGYCTPGFVMSLFAEQYRPEQKRAMQYLRAGRESLPVHRIPADPRRRVVALAALIEFAQDDKFGKRLAMPPPVPEELRYATFLRPSSLAQCLSKLAKDPHARVVAGATDLAVESNLKVKRFGSLVGVELLPELHVFRETETFIEPGFIEIGSALSLDEIGALWRNAPAFLRQWLDLFASPQIRNRATLGGNLATASPIGDSAPLLLALDAEVRIVSRSGMRSVPLHAFFTGYRRTVLQPGELLAAIRIPKPLPQIVRFYKVAKRRLDDISTVAAAFALSLDRAGRVELVRLAYGGVAAVPTRARAAEACLVGSQWDAAALGRAQSSVERELVPMGDHRGSAAYRLAMAQSLIAKFQHETQGDV